MHIPETYIYHFESHAVQKTDKKCNTELECSVNKNFFQKTYKYFSFVKSVNTIIFVFLSLISKKFSFLLVIIFIFIRTSCISLISLGNTGG